jgi:hypothetical protein
VQSSPQGLEILVRLDIDPIHAAIMNDVPAPPQLR